jgi:hypothetical protein
MSLRCDQCRRPLGLVVRRYWHMRFCSHACVRSYQRRLQDDTKQKIADIRDADRTCREQPRLPARLLARGAGRDRAQRDTAGRLAG